MHFKFGARTIRKGIRSGGLGAQAQTDIGAVILRQLGESRIAYLPWDIDRAYWEVMCVDHGILPVAPGVTERAIAAAAHRGGWGPGQHFLYSGVHSGGKRLLRLVLQLKHVINYTLQSPASAQHWSPAFAILAAGACGPHELSRSFPGGN